MNWSSLSITRWSGWGFTIFGTTETTISTTSVTIPSWASRLAVYGSVRITSQDDNRKDMTIYVRIQSSPSVRTSQATITTPTNGTYVGSNLPITDVIAVTPGSTITLELRATASTGSGGSAYGSFVLQPLG